MLSDNSLEWLDGDMVAYLQYEANRRGVTIEEAYQEEISFQQKAEAQSLTPDELKALANASNPDPRLLQGDEEYPF